MSHIHIKKQPDNGLMSRLMVQAQVTILVTSILVLGACTIGATVRIHQLEQQLAAQARV